jgi:hypothetical protein
MLVEAGLGQGIVAQKMAGELSRFLGFSKATDPAAQKPLQLRATFSMPMKQNSFKTHYYYYYYYYYNLVWQLY